MSYKKYEFKSLVSSPCLSKKLKLMPFCIYSGPSAGHDKVLTHWKSAGAQQQYLDEWQW